MNANVVPVERGFLETPHVSSWVYGSCGIRIGSYYCATCGVSCPTRAHMRGHVEEVPNIQHQVVFDCPKHGFEVPPKPSSAEKPDA